MIQIRAVKRKGQITKTYKDQRTSRLKGEDLRPVAQVGPPALQTAKWQEMYQRGIVTTPEEAVYRQELPSIRKHKITNILSLISIYSRTNPLTLL